ncbi:hypothetical protein [Hungatella hathewayi]|uniref:hypothetical protein n=1 Tax=Hungatella hathewayi TaxID=154046 RepID=UPI003564B830
MKRKEFDKIEQKEKTPEPLISTQDLNNKQDRTLLYGYTCNRATWHVYLKNGDIHIVVYRNSAFREIPVGLKEVRVKANQDYIPDKRLYPAACDYEFCRLLKEAGCHLPFTNFEDREQIQFHGYITEDSEVSCLDCANGDNPQHCNVCEEYLYFKRKNKK